MIFLACFLIINNNYKKDDISQIGLVYINRYLYKNHIISKALLDVLVSANPIQRIEDIEAVLPNKVDKALFSDEGRALIFNEVDGGGGGDRRIGIYP